MVTASNGVKRKVLAAKAHAPWAVFLPPAPPQRRIRRPLLLITGARHRADEGMLVPPQRNEAGRPELQRGRMLHNESRPGGGGLRSHDAVGRRGWC